MPPRRTRASSRGTTTSTTTASSKATAAPPIVIDLLDSDDEDNTTKTITTTTATTITDVLQPTSTNTSSTGKPAKKRASRNATTQRKSTSPPIVNPVNPPRESTITSTPKRAPSTESAPSSSSSSVKSNRSTPSLFDTLKPRPPPKGPRQPPPPRAKPSTGKPNFVYGLDDSEQELPPEESAELVENEEGLKSPSPLPESRKSAGAPVKSEERTTNDNINNDNDNDDDNDDNDDNDNDNIKVNNNVEPIRAKPTLTTTANNTNNDDDDDDDDDDNDDFFMMGRKSSNPSGNAPRPASMINPRQFSSAPKSEDSISSDDDTDDDANVKAKKVMESSDDGDYDDDEDDNVSVGNKRRGIYPGTASMKKRRAGLDWITKQGVAKKYEPNTAKTKKSTTTIKKKGSFTAITISDSESEDDDDENGKILNKGKAKKEDAEFDRDISITPPPGLPNIVSSTRQRTNPPKAPDFMFLDDEDDDYKADDVVMEDGNTNNNNNNSNQSSSTQLDGTSSSSTIVLPPLPPLAQPAPKTLDPVLIALERVSIKMEYYDINRFEAEEILKSPNYVSPIPPVKFHALLSDKLELVFSAYANRLGCSVSSVAFTHSGIEIYSFTTIRSLGTAKKLTIYATPKDQWTSIQEQRRHLREVRLQEIEKKTEESMETAVDLSSSTTLLDANSSSTSDSLIALIIRDKDGEVKVKSKSTTKILNLMNHFRKVRNLPAKAKIKFEVGGERMEEEGVVADYDCENGDLIDAKVTL